MNTAVWMGISLIVLSFLIRRGAGKYVSFFCGLTLIVAGVVTHVVAGNEPKSMVMTCHYKDACCIKQAMEAGKVVNLRLEP